MRIIVISLPRATERRASITAQFQKLNIAFEFLDATDARDLSDAELEHAVDNNRRRQISRYPLTKGEVACRISHESAFQWIANGNDPMAITMEDDAVLLPNFAETIASIEKLNRPFDAIALHKIKGKRRFFVPLKKLVPDNHIGIVGYSHTALIAQVVSQSGARKFLKNHPPYSLPIDSDLYGWWHNGSMIYALKNAAVETFDAGYSYIDNVNGAGTARYQTRYKDHDDAYQKAARFIARLNTSIAKRALFPLYVARGYIDLHR